MRSHTTRRFRELIAALPRHVQQQSRQSYRLFRPNPSHPGLRFKQVHEAHRPIYSVRVGLGYRAVGVLDDDEIAWFWIGSQADYDRLLDTL